VKSSRDSNATLTQEERRVLTSIPYCKEWADKITFFGNALGLTSEPLPFPSNKQNLDQDGFEGTLLTGIGFANEGHGWLIVNNRLSTGQTAVAHLGVKYRDYQSLLSSANKEIEFKYTKQPVALRFKSIRGTRKVTEGYGQLKSCTETIYIQECTRDPGTGRGECKQVPYDVEGSKRVRTDIVEETSTNLIEYTTPDFSKVLGVAQLATKSTYEDIDWGTCEVQQPTPYPPRPY
jgi:hypothetical protein